MQQIDPTRFLALTSDLLCVADFDGHFTYLNSVWTSTLGWPGETLQAKSWLEFVHPDDRPAVQVALEKISGGQAEITFECRCRCQNGAYKWLAWRATGFPEEGVMYALVRDITNRKAAEAQLELQAAALESAANAIAIADREGIICWVNPAFTELTGYSAEEAIGQSFRLLNSGRQAPAFYQELWETIQAGQVWRGRLINQRKDGTLYHEAQIITPVPNAQGQIFHFVSIKQDISDWLQHEREISAIATVATALRTALSRTEILPIILDQVLDLVHADGAALVLTDPANGQLVIELANGAAAEFTGLVIPPAEPISRQVMTSGRAYVSDDILVDQPDIAARIISRSYAMAAVPLIAQQKKIGILAVGRTQPISPEEVRVLEAIVDIAANAIQRATFYDQTKRYLQQLVSLRKIDVAITASLELPVTLNVLLEQVIQQLNVDAADVLLLDSDGQELVCAAAKGFQADALTRVRLPVRDSHAGRAILERRLVNVPNLAEDLGSMVRAKLLAAEGFVTYYGKPLVANERVIGVLEIFHQAPLLPKADWLDFFGAIAAQAAVVVDHSRLYVETRQLLTQTQKHSHQIQQLIDTIPDGVLLLDVGLKIKLANPTAWRYLAHLATLDRNKVLTSLAGRPVEEFLEPGPDGLWHEVKLTEPDHRIFETDAQPIIDGPQSGGWVLLIRDVTREREVQQRAQQQERLAAIGQLAAGIAHDFNNILTSVIGFAELAHSDPAVDKNWVLEHVAKQGKRAAALIRQMLDFSRQTITDKREIDMVPFLKETIFLLERTISEDIEINLSIDPAVKSYLLEADPVQIQQILTNLAINARDAMPAGGRLQFHLSQFNLQPGQPPPCPKMSPGTWLVLSVSDSGSGIPPAIIPRLFEPFFTTKEPGKGTGLGLAQVYGLVKQHGGEIDVASRVAEGTTFTLYLPALAPAQSSSRPASIESPLPRGQDEMILLVEDDVSVLVTVKSMLKSLGYQVLTASNGHEALAVFEQYGVGIALVLTDVTMPGMGGIALAQALHALDPAVKIVAMSGYPEKIIAKQSLLQNVLYYLKKPITTKQLASAMCQVLKR